MCTKNIALTIAGFDPGSGAGVTADLKTFAAHHIYGVACISALTVQSTLGVQSVETLSSSLVRQTLECLAADVILSGIKIGMLGSHEIVSEVANFLAGSLANVPRRMTVLDPVLRSSSGSPLIDPNGVTLIRNRLLQRIGWITPNIQELAILVEGQESIPSGASRLREMAARLGNDELNVVVTGGDLDQPDDFLLTSSGDEVWLKGEKVVTNSTHGTGCAFSSALLCELLLDRSPVKAVESAKEYVTQALRMAYPVGRGKGPINHLFSHESKG
jgi:hydroxymethylpyrimidine/phosphomethylpyrimidine kinase